MPIGKYKRSKSRGKYKIDNVFDNPRYTKSILLLSQGEMSRKELIGRGINPSNWDKLSIKRRKKYKEEKISVNAGLREVLIKEKIIYENSIKKQYNMQSYLFNWDEVVNNIYMIKVD